MTFQYNIKKCKISVEKKSKKKGRKGPEESATKYPVGLKRKEMMGICGLLN